MFYAGAVIIVLLFVGYIVWKRFPLHLIIKSKRHLESIFDSIPDPIAVIDKNHTLQRINRAYVNIVGMNFRDVLGSPCYRLFPKTDKLCENCLVEEVIRSGAPSIQKARRVIISGETRYYDFYLFPLKERRSGKVESITEYIKDVTEEVVAKKQLEEAKQKIEDAYKVVQEEIELARNIQQSILPTTFPEIEGAKIAASYFPVESVGGDLYDFICLGKHRFGVFLGDVSGHGLAAAFVGAMVKMSLYTHSHNNLSPKIVMKKINDDLNRNISTGHYLTGVYGVLDLNDNTFIYTRASHPYPLLVHNDGKYETLDTSGLFIGMIENANYGEDKIQLEPNDRLYLFTDGFYEYHNENKKMLGREGFHEILIDAKDVPAKDVPDMVADRIKSYYQQEDLDDDRSLVVIDLTEKSRKERFRLLCDFDKDEDIVVATFSKFEEGGLYISMILREMDKHGYCDDYIRQMKIVITELFSNAIEHGNRGDLTKKLDVAFVVDNDKVKIACVDEGTGFRISDVPDPTTESNIAKDRGRGVYIIKNFVDEIMQNEAGNRVTVIKYKKSKN